MIEISTRYYRCSELRCSYTRRDFAKGNWWGCSYHPGGHRGNVRKCCKCGSPMILMVLNTITVTKAGAPPYQFVVFRKGRDARKRVGSVWFKKGKWVYLRCYRCARINRIEKGNFEKDGSSKSRRRIPGRCFYCSHCGVSFSPFLEDWGGKKSEKNKNGNSGKKVTRRRKVRAKKTHGVQV